MATEIAATTSTTSSAPAWRQFSFFDSSTVTDVHDLASPPEIFKTAAEISIVIYASVGVLVADIHGHIHMLDQSFNSVRSWVVHVGGRVTHMIERKRVLVTLGEMDNQHSPLLNLWDLGHSDEKTGAPQLLRSVKLQQSNRPHPVTTIALSATLSHLAVAFADGTVLLLRNPHQSSSPRPRTIHESPEEPVTGLGFKEPSTDDEDNDANLHLFIATTNMVVAYQVSGKGSSVNPAAIVVNEVGCALGCATMDWSAQHIIVAKDEAIYVCGTDGRGTCYAYEGYKSSIVTHLNYLVIVSPPLMPSTSAASATVRKFAAHHTAGDTDITKVTVFDMENKLVAYSGAFTQGVRQVISAWGHIYVLCSDGNLFCLKERSTSDKLDMLYRKSLYLLALNLAKAQRLDPSNVADIHRQYGSHLYNKGDYDGAMQQFVKTIGHVQPSYVIRKFLDAQKIHNLVTYLQELHSLGLANSDHTTLLLNTYTKLKDVARLDSFIKTEGLIRYDSTGDERKELPFDLDTAIRVCRQAGYFEHASYLAEKYERHEDYLRIQVEDAGKYREALEYLRKLGPEAAESNLARYGRAMLDNLPQETTQLLIDLCTNSRPQRISAEETPTAKQGTGAPLAQPAPPLTPKPPSAKLLSPRLYFAHFVDHMDQFLVFLERVAEKRWGQSVGSSSTEQSVPLPPADEEADKQDQLAVWNTLLELYLTLQVQGQGATLRDKAQKVLQSSTIPYDPTHALILCSSRQYTPGLVLLWEKMGMYEDVLRFWIDQGKEGSTPSASAEVVRHLNLYGPGHPQLYPLVLRFLTSTPALLARHKDDVHRMLKHVDEKGILPPLGIIQVLSRNGVASVGMLKDWLIGQIGTARAEMQTDQKLISSYRSETAAKLKLVEELSDPQHPRVFHVTRCSSCSGQLDLPSVHFMCGHSYHQRCIVDQETECPKCVREHGLIREIRSNNSRLADQHDLFMSQVSENGFSAVAEAFGRGVLNT